MKQLHIPEEGQFSLDSVSPACEGFVDLVRGLFSRDTIEANLKNIYKSDAFNKLRSTLEEDLKRTYDNEEWLASHLSDKAVFRRIPRTGLFVVGRKTLEDPREVVKVAAGQLRVVQKIFYREKPFIDLRRRLVAKLQNEDNPEEFYYTWINNQSQLRGTAPQRYYQGNKRATPALGYSAVVDSNDSENNVWPVVLKNGQPELFCTRTDWDESAEEELPIPSLKTAKYFADSIRELTNTCITLGKIAEDAAITSYTKMPFGIHEHGMEYGEEIAEFIYAGDEKREVADLALSVARNLMDVVCGMYILMFDPRYRTTG